MGVPRGQGHVSNFYIVDLENFTTTSRLYTGDIHNSTVVGLFMTHCIQLNLQLHTIGLVRTCRVSSFCTVAWQLARLLLTRRIARSLGDSCASCYIFWSTTTPLSSRRPVVIFFDDDRRDSTNDFFLFFFDDVEY